MERSRGCSPCDADARHFLQTVGVLSSSIGGMRDGFYCESLRIENQVKRRRRENKITLIEKLNPRWQDLAEKWGREMRFRGQSLVRIP